ncbi:YadA-like family protein [Haemophilus haemolyticus]|uniref:YadA-like C-terminal region n=1 Tax=Haemophilus haemolyticus TaxID=726 RepID=A0A2X4UIH8_HAEHA|nr:YadA-like family protein [Haemophilus haemolyticus]SQH97714.1 YadA-like C-terminal region [Haemophilus haemolyticus]
MNKIFKIIWNKTTQRLEVVSELAKSQGKAKASTDKRESLNDSSLKGFKLTQGLKPLSLLVAFALAMPSYAVKTAFPNSQNGSLNIWGSDNKREGTVNDQIAQAAVITGAGNTLGDEADNGTFYTYDNRITGKNGQQNPNGINIFGRDNKVNVGNKVNVVGINNKILNTAVGNSGLDLEINAVGNNITVMNPRRSSYFGNDIYGNSAYLGIGNNLHIAAGGQAVGTDIRVAGDSMAIGSNITSSKNNNFLVGDSLNVTNANQFISGKGITSGLNDTTLLGKNIKETGGYADGSFIAGNNVNLTVPQNSPANKAVVMGVDVDVTGGTKAVTIGSNVTTTSSSNSFTAGTDIITTRSASGVTIGHNVTSTGGTNSVVIGQSASTLASNTITLGSNNATTEQTYSIAIGNNASVVNTKSANNAANQENGIAIGRNSVTKKDSGIALGLNAVSNNTADIVIGRNSKTTDTTNSTLSRWTVSDEDVLAKYNKTGTIQTTGANGGVVSFGSEGTNGIKRQLKNVAAGDVSATSTDAINGAQLYALAEVVKPGTLTINAGGTAAANKVADWKANSNKTIGFESANNNLVVSADAANSKVKFTLADNLTVSSVTANGVEIGKGNVAVNANNKKITGLADATLSTTSNEAVTGKQLNETNNNITALATKLETTTQAANAQGYVHVNSRNSDSTITGNAGKYDEAAGATGNRAIAVGIAAQATNLDSIAIGTKNKNGSISTISIGESAEVGGYSQHSVAIGTGAKLGVTNQSEALRTYRSIAIGHNSSVGIKDDKTTGVMAEDAVALGSATSVQANNGVAIGRAAKAKHASSVALGHDSETQDEADINTVADLMIDGVEVAKKGVKKTNGKGSISVGKNGLNRQIFNVGAGRITADSTDAINGSQLFHVANATNTAIKGIKDTTFTFNIANGVTDATLKTGSQAWSIGAQNSITFGATSDLSVTRKDGFIVYGLSETIKKDISLAKSNAEAAKTAAEAAKTAAEAAKTTAGEAKTIAQEAKDNSPYEIWKAKPANTGKSKDDFLTALKGEKGENGTNGKSAFDAWKDANNKPNATEAEFLTALKGEKGENGTNGKSAFDAWKDANNKPNATEAEFLTALKGEKGENGTNGKSAYDIWKEKPENAGKSKDEFVTALKGEKGETGPVGPKGDKGDTGPRGPKGDAGTGGSVTKVTTDNSGNLSVKPKANGDTEITLNKDLQGLNSISIGSDPSAVRITENGLNNGGHRITNVAAGVKPTDAANVAQVNAVENRLNNKIGKLDKKLRGGIANAVAVANIPQVTIPGANMVAVGTGNYKGQSALAVGYSRASDNNRVIIKMSASATTQGDYSVGGGIGYQW